MDNLYSPATMKTQTFQTDIFRPPTEKHNKPLSPFEGTTMTELLNSESRRAYLIGQVSSLSTKHSHDQDSI